MLKARIIPCLDVKDGRTVKGVNFVDLRDAGDPVEQATVYDAAGADELCFLDITASHEKRGILFDVVARTAERCFMPAPFRPRASAPSKARPTPALESPPARAAAGRLAGAVTVMATTVPQKMPASLTTFRPVTVLSAAPITACPEDSV